MLSVAVLLYDESKAKSTLSALAKNVVVETCSSSTRLLEILSEARSSTLVISLADPLGKSNIPLVRTVRQRFPQLPIVGAIGAWPNDLRQVVPGVQAGLTDIVDIRFEELWAVVQPLVTKGGTQGATADVVSALGQYHSTTVWPAIEYAVRNAKSGPNVDQLAAALGSTRKQIYRWFLREGLQPPSAVLRVCRLLVAARLLADPGRSVHCVARDVGYSTSVGLRRALRWRLNLSPSEVRKRGLHGLVPRLRRGELVGDT